MLPFKIRSARRALIFFCWFVMASLRSTAQFVPEHPKVYPTNWWVGMKNPALQVMIHGRNIGQDSSVQIVYPGVRLLKVHWPENPNYLFLDLLIAPDTKPGLVRISIGRDPKATRIDFPLESRRPGNGTQFAQGVTSADLIYFLMPDRFSNGDPANDRISGLRDQSLNRDSIFLRHGGDFQGIINHLGYIQDLGATTLWMTPVLLNDMPNRTEHGYAFTDHYTIDPRLGGAEGYKRLSDSLHRRGMKLIQDAVYNHVGLYHFLVQDPPSKDWLHQWPVFTQTTYRDQPLMDPHAAESDQKVMSDGWFTRQMPDLNQDNPYTANFLIQHAIWCVETFGVDGWRIDTYIYCDLPFMNRCNKALTDEYPNITMFGETWVHGTANQAYFADNTIATPFKSNLQGVVDFQCLFNGISPVLADTSGNGWGVNELYSTLSDDFLYTDPTRNVIFLDNHDMNRIFSQARENVEMQKIGIKWLMTCRGIPQIYYGTEVLMKGFANPDGWVRLDFPGGWPGDKKNAFTGKGLSTDEASVQDLVRKMGKWRSNSSALRTGRLMQYAPKRGLYVYFRYDEKETVMCIMNMGKADASIDFSHYSERTTGFARATDPLTGEVFPMEKPMVVPAMTMRVLELKK